MPTIDDFKNSYGLWAQSKHIDGLQYMTYSGRKWARIRDRCKINGYEQQHYSTYRGCYMGPDFLNFNTFCDWLRSRKAYNLSGYQVDKDILVHGNKIYTSEMCTLVPSQLNVFFAINIKESLGVHFHSRIKKYGSCISIDGKQTHLGYFCNPKDAQQAYITAKENEARRWAKRLMNKEFIVDDIVIDRLNNWKVQI